MNTPAPSPATPSPRTPVGDNEIRAWLKLRSELSELHARLEYLRLIVSLGVRRVD